MEAPIVAHSQRLTIKSSLEAYLKSSWLNILLVFIPFGFISHYVHWPANATFFLNFLAIIPLAKLLGVATEEISIRTGEIIGGLLNATFGNAVEMIISILALSKGLVRIVQTSLLGSILSNLLLVLGLCFLAGGVKYAEQTFNQTSAQTSSALLALSVFSLVVPAAFHAAPNEGRSVEEMNIRVLQLSRGVSIILLIIYGLYLYFQLHSHKHLFINVPDEQVTNEEEIEEPTMLFSVALGCLVVVTVIVALCADFMVESIDVVSKDAHIPESFIGMILVPIVGNAAEHLTAVTCAMKNKIDLSISVAVGSSMQIALLVTPIMVLIGWMLNNKEMGLDFHVFETAVLFMSVLIVNYLIQDGRSNWLEGAMLLAAYAIVAIAFFFY